MFGNTYFRSYLVFISSRTVKNVLAIQMTTLNAAEYLGIGEIGAIIPSSFADIVILNDFKEFKVSEVIMEGQLLIKNGKFPRGLGPRFKYPDKVYKTINMRKLESPSDLLIRVGVDAGVAEVIAIRVVPGKTVTRRDRVLVKVRNKYLRVTESQDISHVCVIERHHATGGTGRRFVTGLSLRRVQ